MRKVEEDGSLHGDDEMRPNYRREDLGLLERGKYVARHANAFNAVGIQEELNKFCAKQYKN